MKKGILTLTFLGMVTMALTGCGKKQEATTEVMTTQTISQETTAEDTSDSHEGKAYNELTGEWSKGYVSKRPVAVMINNIQVALPSSSTKEADIIYECMVEGGITRLMAIYSDYEKLEKIGSVRSARPYYINIANEFDAFYVHYGQSEPAKTMLDSNAINNINGMTYDNGFYRDSSRQAPHNAYTTGEKIKTGIADLGYVSEYSAEHKPVFTFNEKDTALSDGEVANTVHVNFSNYSKPYFIYNKKKKLYDRYEYDAPQIDEQAKEKDNILNFKNVIIQISSYTCINTDNDLQDLTQIGEGEGYYCTNGKAIPITWKKLSGSDVTKYYTQDGKELVLNPGKTWVSIIGNGENAGVSFE